MPEYSAREYACWGVWGGGGEVVGGEQLREWLHASALTFEEESGLSEDRSVGWNSAFTDNGQSGNQLGIFNRLMEGAICPDQLAVNLNSASNGDPGVGVNDVSY